ncbi:MAG: hypothetical protein ACRC02_02120, partial [Vogesella sp.]|uniref:hypothetical protein n=1 Tax=Vogesella sp. TaxID=1904252 RepID=UPI003F2DE7FE
NVVVSGSPQKWTISFQGRLSGRDVPELVFSPVQELALQAAASGSTSFSVKLAGSTAASKTVTITGFDDEQVRAALQDALASLDGVGAGNVSVAGQDGQWLITFTGELAGQVVAGVELTRTVDTTVEKVKAKAVSAAMLQVSAIEPQLKAGGITWGKLQFKPVNVDDFAYFAIRPSAGVSIDVVTPGTAQLAEVQRLRIVNAAMGAASQFELQFTDKAGKKAEINGLAVDISASQLQERINTAFTNAGIDGSVTVAVSVMNEPVGTRVPEGTRAFDITFAGKLATGDQPAFTTTYQSLRAKPGAQMVAYSLQQGAAATATSVAKNEVQRLTISNAVGGTYGFAQRVGSEYYTLNEPFAYGASAAQQETELKKAGLDDAAIAALKEGKTAEEALAIRQAKLIELGLRKAFATGPKAIAGADVTVTAVAGLPDTFDIVYGGSLAGEDLPTLLLNSSQLKSAAQAAGDKGYAGVDLLGLDVLGQEARTQSGPKFNTLEEFAAVLQDAVNELLPKGETFNVTARFDAQAMDFMFDLRFTPAMPQQLVPLDFGFDLAPVGDFSAKGNLVLNAGIDFVTTIGLDFNRPDNFSAVGGTVNKAELVANASAGVANVGRVLFNQAAAYNATSNPAIDAKFTMDIDGERYELTLDAARQADNNSVEDLLADLNAVLEATAVKANGKLAVVNYSKLGQAARFSLV